MRRVRPGADLLQAELAGQFVQVVNLGRTRPRFRNLIASQKHLFGTTAGRLRNRINSTALVGGLAHEIELVDGAATVHGEARPTQSRAAALVAELPGHIRHHGEATKTTQSPSHDLADRSTSQRCQAKTNLQQNILHGVIVGHARYG